MAAILGNPAWSGCTIYNTIYNFQTIIGGGIAGGLTLIGIVLGFRANRLRDQQLQREEARGLAVALYAELKAALVTSDAFVGQVKTALEQKYSTGWLSGVINETNFAPRVRTKVYEANAAKIGLLGEPLATEITMTYDQLFDYARLADKWEILPRSLLLKKRGDCASQLESDFIPALKETINILQAYISGGLPAAAKAALSLTPEREKRHKRLGKELGIVPATDG